MAQALVAAYKTVNPDFQIHHLTTQFLQPAHGKLPLSFEVTRTNDSKNNAARTVSIIQKDRRIAVIVLSFIRRPILDKQSPNYQPHFPNYKTIEEPDEEVDDMKFAGKGMLQAQGLGRTFSRIFRFAPIGTIADQTQTPTPQISGTTKHITISKSSASPLPQAQHSITPV